MKQAKEGEFLIGRDKKPKYKKRVQIYVIRLSMGSMCSKDNADADSSHLTQEYNNNAVISSGIRQIQGNSFSPTDPHQYFTGETFDSMSLANRLTFFPANTETVLYSSAVVKTNKRGKQQDRIWCLTDAAFYSFADSNFSETKRRIPLDQIKEIFVNNSRTQMIIRVPRSYDYLSSADTTSVNAFCSILHLAALKANTPGDVKYIPCTEDDISNRCVTKGSDTGNTWKTKRGRVR